MHAFGFIFSPVDIFHLSFTLEVPAENTITSSDTCLHCVECRLVDIFLRALKTFKNKPVCPQLI